MPCRHILRVVGEPHTIMYSIRWLAQYQFAYEREGNQAITNIFKLMEKNKMQQDYKNGEHVNVNGVFLKTEF